MKLNLLLHAFPWITGLPSTQPGREEIAPSQGVLVISSENPDAFDLYRWGLIPSWAKDPSIGNKMFNARAETLADKAAFKTALKKRRCLIPADGFYEWKKESGTKRKTKYLFQLASGEPFAFAGLWEVWHDPQGTPVHSCTLITTTPNELVKPVHDRMPAMIRPGNYQQWVGSHEIPPNTLPELLGPYPAGEMQAEPVIEPSGAIGRPETGSLFD